MRRFIALWLCLIATFAHAQSIPFPGPGMPAATGHAMITPIMNAVAAMSNSATQFTGILGGGWSATNNRDMPMGSAGTISNLIVRMPTTIVAGSYQITLFKNGSAAGSPGNFSCTVSTGVGPQTCTDSTNTVSVAAGDTLAWQSIPTTTPAAQTAPTISALFTSTANGESFIGLPSTGNAQSQSAKNYIVFGSVGSSSGWNATEANAAGIMPTAGVMDKLFVSNSVAPGAARSFDYTIFKNGVATAITCQMTGAGSGAGITTCSDLTHSATYAAGDTLSIETSPAGTPSSGNLRGGLRFVPTTPGEAVVMNVNPSALSASSARFMPVSYAGEAGSEVVFSQAPSAFTVKNMYIAVDVAPGGATSRTQFLRTGTGAGQSNSTITCVLTSGTACNDTTHTYSASTNDLLDISMTPASTPATIAFFKQSWVFYTP